MLEYSASGLPVVASPVGTNQMHVVEGQTGFLVDSKQEWIERISQLVEDKQLRRRMGDAGIKHACQSDISVTGQRFVELIKECLGKRVLVISNNPNRASFRQRIGVYIDGLREKGVLVDVVKLPSNQLSRFGIFKNCGDYDAVFVHKKRFNPVDAKVFAYYARKVIYDFDDAIMYDDKRPGRVGGKRGRDFARTAKLSDVVIAGNDYLGEHAAKYTDNIHVLPTGLDVGDYEVESGRGDDGKVRLVWIGSRSTLMYLEWAREALEEVGRRFDNVVLRIICDSFFEMENMEVEKVEWSLERQEQCLCESDIGLAPLPDNEFTRGKCGFKILQYAAAGLPVVASGVGVNREFAKDGVRGFLADSSSQWIEKLSELIENKDLRCQMGDAGREWVKRFDLSVLGEHLGDLIKE
ncbi:MAG: glycosyltransferase [Planctomycetes bacterium]|nr:glycosyltransferase [Planctomycetota bacterium]